VRRASRTSAQEKEDGLPFPALSSPGAALGIVSAVLFGASTPFAKLLLGAVDPWLLAGLLYLGSGIGLAAVHLGRRFLNIEPPEAPLRQADLPWLAAVILAGGVIGPLLLMLGLSVTPASSAALLLNVEGLATMGIAWLVFREATDRRIVLGALLILAGAILLSWQGSMGEDTVGAGTVGANTVGPGTAGEGTVGQGAAAGAGWGVLAIVGACLAWGTDNNLTRRLSAADPVQIAMLKGLVAGGVNLALSVWNGATLPPAVPLLGAGLVGFLGYGVSLVLFVLALRHLGSARTGAYFSTAPFIGAVLALALFDEPITVRLLAAAALMGAGLWLHLAEHHEHEHLHEAMMHEHVHVHDAHHQHAHGPDDPPGEPHVHVHRHAPMMHRHPHFPDLHHRHTHTG
jgi:drug/metabolite transporter (DMT)-like permease